MRLCGVWVMLGRVEGKWLDVFFLILSKSVHIRSSSER